MRRLLIELFCGILATAVQGYAQGYHVTDLGALLPVAVIDGPVVFGNLNNEPVVWQDGQVRALQHFGLGGQVNGANARGDSVGYVVVPTSGQSSGRVASFWYPDGQVTLLPGSGETLARGLNMARTIAGANLTNGKALRWYPEGQAEELGFGWAVGADRLNRAWGFVGSIHAGRIRVWDANGQEHQIFTPGALDERVFAVNEDGLGTGDQEIIAARTSWATRVTLAGGVHALPSGRAEAPRCSGQAINARGDIGGFCARDPFTGFGRHAAFWPASGGIIHLDTAVSVPGWFLLGVYGVSNDGHLVVGAGSSPERSATPSRGFLLTPATEPPALALRTNENLFSPGETLHASVERNGVAADLHVAVILPDGVTTLFLTNIETLSYIVSTIERGPYPVTTGASLTHTWHGLNEPGVYHIIAALARRGSLADGRIDAGDIIALDWKAVQFAPQMVSR